MGMRFGQIVIEVVKEEITVVRAGHTLKIEDLEEMEDPG